MTQATELNREKLSVFLRNNFQVHDWSKVQSLHIIGSFADPNKEVTEDSDLDILLVWDNVDAHIENQNKNPNGISGMESLQKWDNPMIETPNGKRPVDIVETTPLEGVNIPEFALRVPIPN